ncbi:MAG: hypothetical protein RLZZ540_1005 [Bacteroidota bacterium]|jgi:hypothetical protein
MGIGSVGQDARSHIEVIFQYDCEKKEFESSNTLKKHYAQQLLQRIWAISLMES